MRISIFNKIIIPLLIGLFLVILSTGHTFLILNRFISFINSDSELFEKIELTSQLQLLIDQMLMPPNDYISSGNISEREQFAVFVTDVAGVFGEIKEKGKNDPEWSKLAEDVKKDVIELERKAMGILSVVNPVGNKNAVIKMEEMDAFADRLIDKVSEFHNITIQKRNILVKKNQHTIALISFLFKLITAISFAGLAIIIYIVRNKILAPLRHLYEGVKIVESGRLDHRIDIKTKDELGEISSEFNKMTIVLKSKIDETQAQAEKLDDLNRQLDQKIFELYTLYNIGKVLSASFEVEKHLDQVVGRISQALRLDSIVVMLCDDSQRHLQIISSIGFSDGIKEITVSSENNLYGWVLMNGRSKIIQKLSEEKDYAFIPGLDDNAKSIMCIPFKGRGKVIGLLSCYLFAEEGFSENTTELLNSVALQVGIALENSILYRETKLLSITDGMTLLYNYRHFMQNLKEEIEKAKRYSHPLSMIMMDIDHFKKYNDTHGHPAGDELLKRVSEILKENIRTIDFAARYGGEEFAIILPETDIESALIVAEKIRKLIFEENFYGKETQPNGRISVSIGVSSFPPDGVDAELIVKAADNRLYEAKIGGRNRICSQ